MAITWTIGVVSGERYTATGDGPTPVTTEHSLSQDARERQQVEDRITEFRAAVGSLDPKIPSDAALIQDAEGQVAELQNSLGNIDARVEAAKAAGAA